MARPLDLRDTLTAAFAASSIDRGERPDTTPLPDAIDGAAALNPTVEEERGPVLIPAGALNQPAQTAHLPPRIPADGPLLDRDREVLLEIARYRLVSFAHLKAFVFSNRHSSVLTRRMHALKQAGFITTWDEQLARGGHPRFALLTQKGLTWAIETLRASAAGCPHEQLVSFMLRTRAKRPLTLAPRTAPPFLPHQVETNRLAATIARTPVLGIIWASTWHRPFPNAVRGVSLPQPDAVLVQASSAGPRLLFVEHDRSQESPGSFSERKTQRYQLLMDLGLARELLGFESFTVLVTVVDPVRHRLFDRIPALQDVSAASPILRFAPAGWAHAQPAAAVWFTPGTPVQTSSLRPEHHAGLVSAFSNLG